MTVFDKNGWLIDCIVVGDLMVNCYIVLHKESRSAVIIDPGDEADRIARRAVGLNAKIVAIVITHGHGDHIGANKELTEKFGCPIYIGKPDAEMLTDIWLNLSAPFGMDTTSPPADRLLAEGDAVRIGTGELTVIETPGHSVGSITLLGSGFAIVGDLIFQGSIGRTDFPGGNHQQILSVIRQKIFSLDDDSLLLPGHGETTTVGEEKRTNPFFN